MQTLQKDELVTEVLSLLPIERLEIIDKVIISFDSDSLDEVSISWSLESERRIDSYFKGELKEVDSDKVFNIIKWT
jgi:predicted Zn-dependent protease with MMP-like domain